MHGAQKERNRKHSWKSQKEHLLFTDDDAEYSVCSLYYNNDRMWAINMRERTQLYDQ